MLYSAVSWELLRNSWQTDAAEAAETIELGIRALLSGLRLDPGPPADGGGCDRQLPG